MIRSYQTKIMCCFSVIFLLNISVISQKNFTKEADYAFDNESYFSAIELYKKAYVKEKKPTEKARISFQMAECYRYLIEPEQAETFYNTAIKLKYHKDNPDVYFYLAEVLKEEGEYKEAEESFRKYLELVPDSKLAKDEIESCELAMKWKDEPTKHIIQNEQQINSSSYDYSSAWGDKKHKVLIFSSSRPGSTGEEFDERTGESYMDLWTTTRDNKGKWGEPQILSEAINTPDNEGAAVLTRKADMIFFTRCPREKKENIGCDIFYAERSGDKWKQAKKIELKPDTAAYLSCGHPTLNNNASYMIFASDMPGGQGGKDLWITEYNKREKVWGAPENLGPTINTAGDEMFPHLTDKGTLYFSSTGHLGMGGLDLFKAEKTDEKKWENVENLKYPLNSAEHDYGIIFETNSDERRGFFTSNRNGRNGRDDLYSLNLPPLLFSLIVEVKDKETLLPVPGATIQLTGSDGSQITKTTDADGVAIFEEENKKRFILKETGYKIEVTKEGSLKASHDFTTVGREKSMKFYEEVFLQSAIDSSGEAVVIDFPEVQYAYDKWELLVNENVNSKDSLDYLYNTLMQNPNIVIELQAHTDCRGSARYNRDLSQKRAQSCVDYLISKGISVDRMVPVGKGEDIPRAKGLECKTIDKMGTTEEQEAAHQRNRRTQFKVLSFDYKSKEEK